jgi:2-keto-4-pentenoate hydratase/2-oxohepta-3-ene-1,7-dioic acid hydratase in catechol pathway
VCGTETDVPWPAYCQTLDFELEFGCYIGKPGKDIPKERAREHIFGYTVFNDFSARDEQSKEMAGQLGPGKGKDFDNGNAMGPCLVTADEIGDPYRLEMICRVNGEEWGRGNSRDMKWTFEDCIAHCLALGNAACRRVLRVRDCRRRMRVGKSQISETE